MRVVIRPVRLQRLADPLIALGVALVICSPAIFTHNGFAFDYTNHMWLVWVQEQAISHHLLPTYFVNSSATGIFYPLFMFYGGTLYTVAGGLAALLGGRVVVAYVAVSLLSVMSAYGGMVWLARQFGARSWLAHAPALTFVASAYYVTNIYGRGAWTEFEAVSMLPLVAASGLHLLRAPRIRLGSAVLFVISVVVFSGSHNPTLLLGTLMFALLAVGLVAAIGRVALPTPGRAMLVAGLGLAGVAVNAWFLLPSLTHANSVHIAAGPLTPWTNTTEFNTVSTLFYPFRLIPQGSIIPALYVQAPVWFLAWSVIAGLAFWRTASFRLRRVAGVLAVGLVLVLLCIMVESVWNAMPRTFRVIQFPFRLNTYVALMIAGLVLVAVLALQRSPATRRRQGLKALLIGAAAVSCGLCVWQLWVPNTRVGKSYANWKGVFVSPHVAPATWNGSADYKDVQAPLLLARNGMLVDPNLITGDRVTLRLNPPSGFDLIAMNMGAGSYAVSITGGLERDGRDFANDVVVQRRSKASGPVTFTLQPAGGSVTIGKVITAVTLVGLVLGLIASLCLRLLRRGGRGWRGHEEAAGPSRSVAPGVPVS